MYPILPVLKQAVHRLLILLVRSERRAHPGLAPDDAVLRAALHRWEEAGIRDLRHFR